MSEQPTRALSEKLIRRKGKGLDRAKTRAAFLSSSILQKTIAEWNVGGLAYSMGTGLASKYYTADSEMKSFLFGENPMHRASTKGLLTGRMVDGKKIFNLRSIRAWNTGILRGTTTDTTRILHTHGPYFWGAGEWGTGMRKGVITAVRKRASTTIKSSTLSSGRTYASGGYSSYYSKSTYKSGTKYKREPTRKVTVNNNDGTYTVSYVGVNTGKVYWTGTFKGTYSGGGGGGRHYVKTEKAKLNITLSLRKTVGYEEPGPEELDIYLPRRAEGRLGRLYEDMPEWISDLPSFIQMGMGYEPYRMQARTPDWVRAEQEAGFWGFIAPGLIPGGTLAPTYAVSMLQRAFRAGLLPEEWAPQQDPRFDIWTYAGRLQEEQRRGERALQYGNITSYFLSRARQEYWEFQQTWTPTAEAWGAVRLASYLSPELFTIRALGFPFYAAAQRTQAGMAMMPDIQRAMALDPTGTAEQIRKSYSYWPGRIPTLEEQLTGGVLEWTLAQVAAWSLQSGIRTTLAGEGFGRGFLSTWKRAGAISAIQAGAGGLADVESAVFVRNLWGVPLSEEEQQQVTQLRLINAAALAVGVFIGAPKQYGGLGWGFFMQGTAEPGWGGAPFYQQKYMGKLTAMDYAAEYLETMARVERIKLQPKTISTEWGINLRDLLMIKYESWIQEKGPSITLLENLLKRNYIYDNIGIGLTPVNKAIGAGGEFDFDTGRIGIGKADYDFITDVISHETIHGTIAELAGEDVSVAYDMMNKLTRQYGYTALGTGVGIDELIGRIGKGTITSYGFYGGAPREIGGMGTISERLISNLDQWESRTWFNQETGKYDPGRWRIRALNGRWIEVPQVEPGKPQPWFNQETQTFEVLEEGRMRIYRKGRWVDASAEYVSDLPDQFGARRWTQYRVAYEKALEFAIGRDTSTMRVEMFDEFRLGLPQGTGDRWNYITRRGNMREARAWWGVDYTDISRTDTGLRWEWALTRNPPRIPGVYGRSWFYSIPESMRVIATPEGAQYNWDMVKLLREAPSEEVLARKSPMMAGGLLGLIGNIAFGIIGAQFAPQVVERFLGPPPQTTGPEGFGAVMQYNALENLITTGMIFGAGGIGGIAMEKGVPFAAKEIAKRFIPEALTKAVGVGVGAVSAAAMAAMVIINPIMWATIGIEIMSEVIQPALTGMWWQGVDWGPIQIPAATPQQRYEYYQTLERARAEGATTGGYWGLGKETKLGSTEQAIYEWGRTDLSRVAEIMRYQELAMSEQAKQYGVEPGIFGAPQRNIPGMAGAAAIRGWGAVEIWNRQQIGKAMPWVEGNYLQTATMGKTPYSIEELARQQAPFVGGPISGLIIQGARWDAMARPLEYSGTDPRGQEYGRSWAAMQGYLTGNLFGMFIGDISGVGDQRIDLVGGIDYAALASMGPLEMVKTYLPGMEEPVYRSVISTYISEAKKDIFKARGNAFGEYSFQPSEIYAELLKKYKEGKIPADSWAQLQSEFQISANWARAEFAFIVTGDWNWAAALPLVSDTMGGMSFTGLYQTPVSNFFEIVYDPITGRYDTQVREGVSLKDIPADELARDFADTSRDTLGFISPTWTQQQAQQQLTAGEITQTQYNVIIAATNTPINLWNQQQVGNIWQLTSQAEFPNITPYTPEWYALVDPRELGEQIAGDTARVSRGFWELLGLGGQLANRMRTPDTAAQIKLALNNINWGLAFGGAPIGVQLQSQLTGPGMNNIRGQLLNDISMLRLSNNPSDQALADRLAAELNELRDLTGQAPQEFTHGDISAAIESAWYDFNSDTAMIGQTTIRNGITLIWDGKDWKASPGTLDTGKKTFYHVGGGVAGGGPTGRASAVPSYPIQYQPVKVTWNRRTYADIREGAQHGFEGIVTSSGSITVGEAGAEYVKIIPALALVTSKTLVPKTEEEEKYRPVSAIYMHGNWITSYGAGGELTSTFFARRAGPLTLVPLTTLGLDTGSFRSRGVWPYYEQISGWYLPSMMTYEEQQDIIGYQMMQEIRNYFGPEGLKPITHGWAGTVVRGPTGEILTWDAQKEKYMTDKGAPTSWISKDKLSSWIRTSRGFLYWDKKKSEYITWDPKESKLRPPSRVGTPDEFKGTEWVKSDQGWLRWDPDAGRYRSDPSGPPGATKDSGGYGGYGGGGYSISLQPIYQAIDWYSYQMLYNPYGEATTTRPWYINPPEGWTGQIISGYEWITQRFQSGFEGIVSKTLGRESIIPQSIKRIFAAEGYEGTASEPTQITVAEVGSEYIQVVPTLAMISPIHQYSSSETPASNYKNVPEMMRREEKRREFLSGIRPKGEVAAEQLPYLLPWIMAAFQIVAAPMVSQQMVTIMMEKS